MVATQAIAQFAILAIGTVVAYVETGPIALHVGEQVPMLVEVSINVVETVVPLLVGVAHETRIEAHAEVMALFVEFLRIVGSGMSEHRPRVGDAAGGVDIEHRVDWKRVEIIIGLSLRTEHVGFAIVIKASCVDRDVAGRVNLVVHVQEHVAGDSSVAVVLMRGVGPSHVILAFRGGVAAFQSPLVGSINAVAVTTRTENVHTQAVSFPHITNPR